MNNARAQFRPVRPSTLQWGAASSRPRLDPPLYGITQAHVMIQAERACWTLLRERGYHM